MIRAILLITLSTFVFSSTSVSQKPEAVLIDQFGKLPCDEFNGRIWNLVLQIKQLPASRALVFVHPNSTESRMTQSQLKYILAQFEFEEMEDRVEFRIGREMDGLSYELWKIPAGADAPDGVGYKWWPPKPDTTKPFIFGYEDDIGECPTFVPRKFAEIILANRGSRAYVVIKAASWERGQVKSFADDTIKTLVEKFKIERKRIRTFYVRQKERNSMTFAEYWFVPARFGRNKLKR